MLLSVIFHFRQFNLRMKRDTTLFAQDLKVEVSGEEIPYDTAHIYSGEIFGEPKCPFSDHSFYVVFNEFKVRYVAP